MPTPARHRASKQAARIAVIFTLLAALALTLFVVAAHTPDQAPPEAAAAVVIEPTAAPVQEVCQAPSIEDVRAAVREELDRAVVEVPGKPAKWSVPSTLAAIHKLVRAGGAS